jgi:hypothetical protein
MTSESRARMRPIFLIGVITVIALFGVAWFAVPILIDQYTQGKINEAIKALNLEKSVRYRSANHDLFTGVTILHNLEIKLGGSGSPVQVGELRIESYREQEGVPMEVRFAINNFVVTPASVTNPQIELAMVVSGFDSVQGTVRGDLAIDSRGRTLKVRQFTMHLDDLIDASVRLEYNEVNVESWKSFGKGNAPTAEIELQMLEQVLAQASFVSLDGQLIDLGLTDRIVSWGSRVTKSSKEQFRVTAQQQIMSRIPDDLSMYRAPLAKILRERSRIELSLHPEKPIRLSDPVFSDPQALEKRLGMKLEVTPVGH